MHQHPTWPRRCGALALEPRVLLDAAALATAAKTAAQMNAADSAPEAAAPATGSSVPGAEASASHPAASGDAAVSTPTHASDPASIHASDHGDRDTVTPADASGAAAVDPDAPTLGAPIGSLGDADLADFPDMENSSGVASAVSVGDSVYAVGATRDGIPTLYAYTVASDGTLKPAASFKLADTPITDAESAAAFDVGSSADGKTIYVATGDGVALFARDANGGLTAQGSVTGMAPATSLTFVDDHLYVNDGDTLTVYRHGTDGKWSQVDSEAPPDASPDTSVSFTSLQASEDGKFLFVGTSGSNTLASVYQIASDGTLTHSSDVGAGSGATEIHATGALALSPDGKTLYAVDGGSAAADGSTSSRLYTLAVGNDGSLSVVGNAATLNESASRIVVSKDGNALIVIGKAGSGWRGRTVVDLYTHNADGTLTSRQQIDSFGHDPDDDDNPDYANSNYVKFKELHSVTLSADGTRIYLTGSFASYDSQGSTVRSDGRLAVSLKPETSTFTEDGTAVPVLPGGTLSDPRLDATDNYDGARITIARPDQANADDQFVFVNSGALELSPDGTQILLDGQAVASFVQAGGMLTVTFTAAIGQADAQAVLRGIAYRNGSQDPNAGSARTATLAIKFADGTGHSATLDADVALVGVNDAPIIDATPSNPTYAAGGEDVGLFAGTTIDTVESGQNIWKVGVTLDAVGAGDFLSVNGVKIDIDAAVGKGVQYTNAGFSYAVSKSTDGRSSVVTFYLNKTAADAAKVVDGLTYGNNHSDPGTGTRTVTVAVVEDTEDGENDTSTTSIQSVITLAPAATANTPPTLDVGASAPVPYAEQDPAVALFPNGAPHDAQMDARNGGAGNYAGAVLTITLGAGASAADVLGLAAGDSLTLKDGQLMKDGKAIASVTQSEGVMTFSFTDANGALPTTADVQAALRQITYANASDTPAASVTVAVKLTDPQGASADAQVTVNIMPVNDLPVVDNDPGLVLGDLTHLQDIGGADCGLSTPTASAVSADGSHVYVADDRGDIALFTRDAASGKLAYAKMFPAAGGLGRISQLLLSADGKSLYALRSFDGARAGAIAQYSTDEAGALTLQKTITGDYAGADQGHLVGVIGMALSDDGKTLYAAASDGIAYLTRDSGTGVLSYSGNLNGDLSNAPYLWQPTEIATHGDVVYVVTNNSDHPALIAYARQDDGSLALLGSTTTADGSTALGGLLQVAVSRDGATVAVASDTRVDTYSLDQTSGKFTHRGSATGLAGIRDLALSADGNALFVTLGDGSLNYYATATLALQSAQTGMPGADGIAVSADGGVIVTGSSGIDVLRAPEHSGLSTRIGETVPVPLAPALRLADPELDAAGAYQGASVTITGQAGDAFGFLAANGYMFEGTTISLNGQAVATLVQQGATATLTFTGQVGHDQANAIVRQISYAADKGTATVGAHEVKLVMSDGTAKSAAALVVEVTLAPANRPPQVSDTDVALPDGKAGHDYRHVLPGDLFTDADGDPLTWSASGLPQGLSFDPATHTISGVPTTAGEVTLTLKATDPHGAAAERQIVLTIAANSAPVDSGVDLAPPAGQTGHDYRYVLPAGLFTDADGDPLTWSTSTLPAGLSFDAATHTLGGRVTAAPGAYAITITATDPSGAAVERTLQLTVAAAALAHIDPALQIPAGWHDAQASGAAAPGSVRPMDEDTPQAAARSLQTFLEAAAAGTVRAADELLATLLPPAWESAPVGPMTVPLADGSRSPLVLLAADNGPELAAREAAVDGRWAYDAAADRMVFRLPEGLFASRSAVASIELQAAGGRPLPAGLHFERASGSLFVAGQRAAAIDLHAVVRTPDGRHLSVPVHIAPAAARPPTRAGHDSAAEPMAKPALTEQLHLGPASDLQTQAHLLLTRLADTHGAAPAPVSSAQPAQVGP